MASDFDHALSCPTQAERRAEVARLRAAGYGTPAARRTPATPYNGPDQTSETTPKGARPGSPPSGAGVVNLTDEQWDRIDASARAFGAILVEDDPHASCPCDRCSPDALYRGRSIDRRSDEIEAERERMSSRYSG